MIAAARTARVIRQLDPELGAAPCAKPQEAFREIDCSFAMIPSPCHTVLALQRSWRNDHARFGNVRPVGDTFPGCFVRSKLHSVSSPERTGPTSAPAWSPL